MDFSVPSPKDGIGFPEACRGRILGTYAVSCFVLEPFQGQGGAGSRVFLATILCTTSKKNVSSYFFLSMPGVARWCVERELLRRRRRREHTHETIRRERD